MCGLNTKHCLFLWLPTSSLRVTSFVYLGSVVGLRDVKSLCVISLEGTFSCFKFFVPFTFFSMTICYCYLKHYANQTSTHTQYCIHKWLFANILSPDVPYVSFSTCLKNDRNLLFKKDSNKERSKFNLNFPVYVPTLRIVSVLTFFLFPLPLTSFDIEASVLFEEYNFIFQCNFPSLTLIFFSF